MTGTASPRASIDGWPAAAIASGVVVALLVPPSLLSLLGLNYATASGGAWEKVHPGSDLILLGVGGVVARSGRPMACLEDRARRFPGATVFLAITLFLTFYLIAVAHVPFTPLIDTFVVPIVTVMVLTDLHPEWQARLEAALHVFVACNALLGIWEFLSGWRLIPAELGGVEQTAEVEARAFGLLGHPLSSAAMAGLYAVVLMVGGGRRLPPAWRMPALLLQAMALGAFGGRTALVMAAAAAVIAVGVGALRFLAGRPADLRLVGLGLLAAPLGVAVIGAVAASGFFDVVLNRFVDDNGSASARSAILTVFAYLPWPALLFGPDPDYLQSVQHLVGIEVGVESFWFGFILTFGLLPSLVFFAGFGLFMADVMRRCTPGAWGPLLFFLGIISTSISISAKSTMLLQAVAVLLILLPRHAAQPRARLAPEPAFS